MQTKVGLAGVNSQADHANVPDTLGLGIWTGLEGLIKKTNIRLQSLVDYSFLLLISFRYKLHDLVGKRLVTFTQLHRVEAMPM